MEKKIRSFLKHLLLAAFLLGTLSIKLTYAKTAGIQPAEYMATKAKKKDRTILALTLKEAILLALRKNPTIKSGELQRVVDKFTLAIAYDKFYPQFSLSGQAIYQHNSKPQYSAFPTAKLTTPLGTTFETNLTPSYNSWGNTGGVTSNAHIGVTQPLLRGFGTIINKLDLNEAIDAEKNAQLAWKGQTISVIRDVTRYYYQLVESENNLKINYLSLQDEENILRQVQAKIDAGKLAPSEAIQPEANIANRQLSISRAKASIAENYQNLLAVLGLDPQFKLSVDQKIHALDGSLPSLERSVQLGLANNISYQQALLDYKKAERGIIKAKDNKKWKLDASVALDQSIGGGGTGNGLVNRSFTLNLDIPIHDQEREKGLLSARVLLQKANIDKELKKNQLITLITTEYNTVTFNKEQMKLSAHTVELARQSLEIAKIKFKYGRAAMFELTSLQTALIARQLDYVAQQIQYLNTVEEFYQTLGTTLQRWGVEFSLKG